MIAREMTSTWLLCHTRSTGMEKKRKPGIVGSQTFCILQCPMMFSSFVRLSIMLHQKGTYLRYHILPRNGCIKNDDCQFLRSSLRFLHSTCFFDIPARYLKLFLIPLIIHLSESFMRWDHVRDMVCYSPGAGEKTAALHSKVTFFLWIYIYILW